jgi:hypothetical protein
MFSLSLVFLTHCFHAICHSQSTGVLRAKRREANIRKLEAKLEILDSVRRCAECVDALFLSICEIIISLTNPIDDELSPYIFCDMQVAAGRPIIVGTRKFSRRHSIVDHSSKGVCVGALLISWFSKRTNRGIGMSFIDMPIPCAYN